MSTSILTKPKLLIRKPVDEIKEEEILFYDYETDHQYGPYAKLKTCAVQYGFNSKVVRVDRKERRRELRRSLQNPDIIKVDFNGVNFDRTVGYRHGYFVHPQNAHDVFQILKTISPALPAFSQKFAAFYFLGDPHFAEQELNAWMGETGKPMYMAPKQILIKYNKWDIHQLRQLFCLAWDIVIRDEFWDAYLNDMLIYEPNLEMVTEGGIYLDRDEIWRTLQRLQKTVQIQTTRALRITDGKVTNPNSSKQLGDYLAFYDGIELELTADNNFSVKKSVLVELKEDNELADCAFRIRECNAGINFMENYLNALDDETYERTVRRNWIPVQYSWSSARTRRTTSQSFHRINFQNPNELAKSVQVIPPGQLGWWFDATQIENIVHIYESDDFQRRAAYEDDPDWNEYVWLCNEILGSNKTKDELDDKENSRSPQIPNWTIYKQYKTGKLAINFGMGKVKFCKLFGLKSDVGDEIFSHIHSACPAIRSLQHRVAHDLRHTGYVCDVFGKRYTGSVDQAYKVVAYLIQGCGTGSLPKAQIRANWETLRRFDKNMPTRLRKRGCKCGVMATTTHDENGGRTDLRLGDEPTLQLLQRMNRNMTDKFSPLFDNIPLRAKLYLSKTTADKAIECKIDDKERIFTIINGDPCPKCHAKGTLKDEETKKKLICNHCKGHGYKI